MDIAVEASKPKGQNKSSSVSASTEENIDVYCSADAERCAG